MDVSPDLAADKVLRIIHQVCFHTVDDLHVRVLRDTLLPAERLMGLRKCLDDAVIRNRQGLHAEMIGLPHDGSRGRYRIHIRHLGMAVQLHSLDRRIVISLIADGSGSFDPVDALDHHLLVKRIKIHHSFDQKRFAVFERRIECALLFLVEPELEAHGIRIIRDGNRKNDAPASRFPALGSKYFAPDRHIVGIIPDACDLHRLVVEIPPVDEGRVIHKAGPPVLLLFLRRKLLLFLHFLPALRIGLHNAADLLPDLEIFFLKEVPVFPFDVFGRHFRVRKAGPVPENLFKIVRQLALPVG